MKYPELREEFLEKLYELPYGKRTLRGKSKAIKRIKFIIWRMWLMDKSDSCGSSLNSKYMIDFCKSPVTWQRIKRCLIDGGVIHCVDQRYCPNMVSKKWSLTPLWQEAKWEKTKSAKIDKKPEPPHPQLRKVALDLSLALDKLGERYPKDGDKYRAWKWKFENLKDFKSIKIGKNSRKYHLFNQMPKECRTAILINGTKTVELDVTSSHPVLLASIYSGLEQVKYRRKAESGEIYTDLMKSFSILCRKKAKKRFLSWLYGRRDIELQNYMEDTYPELCAAIAGWRKKGRKKLCYHIQRLESKIINGLGLEIFDGVRVPADQAKHVKAKILERFAKLSLTPEITDED